MKILKITNLKTGQVQQSDFQTHEEAIAHFEKYKAKGFWGKEMEVITHPSRIVSHSEVAEVIGQEAAAEVPATYDANGVEISPFIPAKEFIQAVPFQAAWDEVIPESVEIIPCEYTMEIIDNTAQYTQAIINAEALKFLADTDCFAIRFAETGKPMPIGMAEARAAARLRIVK